MSLIKRYAYFMSRRIILFISYRQEHFCGAQLRKETDGLVVVDVCVSRTDG